MKPDTVRFWLDRNKQVYGLVNAKSEGEMLVLYQSRYYVVKGDAAVLRSGRPVRFTTSTLPASWKKILEGVPEDGVLPLMEPDSTPPKSNDIVPPCSTQTEYRDEELTRSAGGETAKIIQDIERKSAMENEPQVQGGEGKAEVKDTPDVPKKTKRGEGKSHKVCEPIAFACPYCNHGAEAPPARKDGKPFFHVCEKCSGEYAVRVVPVTIYRAEVAAFPRKGSQS